jgi:kinetochore protein Nuf2
LRRRRPKTFPSITIMTSFMPSDYSGGPATTTSPTQYLFPLLKSNDLLICLEELFIQYVTKAELTEPQRHKEKIRHLFWDLLELCTGLTEEMLSSRSPKTDGLKHPDLHDALTDVLFFKELRKLLATCGFYDFSWKDLHAPTSKRLRCQLSAIINLAKFREEQLHKYAELNEPRARILVDLGELHEEHAQLLAQLEQVEEESHAKMEAMDKLARECQDLEMEITRNSKLQAAKRENAATLKREANDLKDEVESAQWALQETQAEEERLMAEVVSSPSRRKNELAFKRERLDNEKDEARNLQEQLQENKAKMVPVQQAIKAIHGETVVQQQVLEEAAKWEQAMEKVHATTKDADSNKEKSDLIQNETEEAERGWMRAEEKISSLRKQGKMKLQAAQDALETAKQQLILGERERREGLARVEAGEAEVLALEEKLKEEQIQTNNEIAALVADYNVTERAFVERNERRMQAIVSSV